MCSRVYLTFDGHDADVKTLTQSAKYFQSTALKANSVKFAGTKEMEEVYAQCSAEVGVNPTETRQCQLQAAKRVAVEQVLAVSGLKLKTGQYELSLEVWDPDSNELIYSAIANADGADLQEAARAAMPQLANNSQPGMAESRANPKGCEQDASNN